MCDWSDSHCIRHSSFVIPQPVFLTASAASPTLEAEGRGMNKRRLALGDVFCRAHLRAAVCRSRVQATGVPIGGFLPLGRHQPHRRIQGRRLRHVRCAKPIAARARHACSAWAARHTTTWRCSTPAPRFSLAHGRKRRRLQHRRSVSGEPDGFAAPNRSLSAAPPALLDATINDPLGLYAAGLAESHRHRRRSP